MSEDIVLRRTKDIVPYIERSMRLTEGTHRGELIDFKNSPWMRKPLRKWQDDRVQKVFIIKATGTGGTYVAEAGTMWVNNIAPNSLGYQVWTKPKARRLAARLYGKLEYSDQFHRRLPLSSRARIGLDIHHTWPFSNLFVQEASESAAQSDRLDTVVCDEPWLYPPGRLEEFWDRTDGASLYDKHVGCSSAPRSDAHEYWDGWAEGDQDEYHASCASEKCGELFLPTIGAESKARYDAYTIQWDPDGYLNYQASTAVIVCPHCGYRHPNKLRSKKALIEGSDYKANNDHADIRHYSCRWNAWIAPWTDYAAMTKKFLEALAALRVGDNSLMMDYVIKREARVYSGVEIEGKKIKITGDYQIESSPSPLDPEHYEIWHAPKWEPEVDRFMTVDVQQAHFWTVAVQTSLTGLRTLYIGKVSTWGDIETIREFLNIKPHHTGVDIRYNPDGDTLRHIAELGYIGLMGEDRDSGYVHTWEESDEEKGRDHHPFSPEETWSVPTRVALAEENERFARVYKWSHRQIMDHLWNMRNGDGSYFGLPSNLEEWQHGPGNRDWLKGEAILSQLDSTRFMEVIDTEKGRSRIKPRKMWRKKTSKSQDHIWDGFSMCLTLMWIEGYFGA